MPPAITSRAALIGGSAALVVLAVVAALLALLPSAQGSERRAVPPVRHVFVVNIENKDYDRTWGSDPGSPYLARTLRKQGVLLKDYYGTAHHSLGNYLAQISGQGPDQSIQDDCSYFTNFQWTGHTLSPGQYVADPGGSGGCVFPKETPTLAGQLDAAGYSWRGYMEDMGTSCRHPKVGTKDQMQQAQPDEQYATRHNPFMYFHSIIDRPKYCASHVVDLSRLTHDLGHVSRTRNLTYITPDLCSDGHDAPCADGRPGGFKSINAWMKKWIPQILASPAFQEDGLLVITADESDGVDSDSSACCGEGPGPNASQPGISGLGGGKVGALVISPFTEPGTTTTTAYNHYSLLASIEDAFGLEHLGYASAGDLPRFGSDIYSK